MSCADINAQHGHTEVTYLAWRDMGLRLLLWDAPMDEWGASLGRAG